MKKQTENSAIILAKLVPYLHITGHVRVRFNKNTFAYDILLGIGDEAEVIFSISDIILPEGFDMAIQSAAKYINGNYAGGD